VPQEAVLLRTIVDLADSLVDDFDIVELLTLLSDGCVEALDVAAAGVMLGAPSGVLQVIASSSETMRDLELFQLQSSEGPCLDSYRSGSAIVNLELSGADGRWPRFTARAIEAGFHSVHSLPLRLRGNTIGALNMFRTNIGPLDEIDVAAAQALADVATIAILQHQATVDAQTLNNQLSQALNSRIIIEQAKGKLGEAAHLDMDQAFQRLRNHARNHNLRLTDLCRAVAEGTQSPSGLDPVSPPRHR
jgi:GAF domain-containing protein